MFKLHYTSDISSEINSRKKIFNILKGSSLNVQNDIKNNGKNLSASEYLKRKQMITIKKKNF